MKFVGALVLLAALSTVDGSTGGTEDAVAEEALEIAKKRCENVKCSDDDRCIKSCRDCFYGMFVVLKRKYGREGNPCDDGSTNERCALQNMEEAPSNGQDMCGILEKKVSVVSRYKCIGICDQDNKCVKTCKKCFRKRFTTERKKKSKEGCNVDFSEDQCALFRWYDALGAEMLRSCSEERQEKSNPDETKPEVSEGSGVPDPVTPPESGSPLPDGSTGGGGNEKETTTDAGKASGVPDSVPPPGAGSTGASDDKLGAKALVESELMCREECKYDVDTAKCFTVCTDCLTSEFGIMRQEPRKAIDCDEQCEYDNWDYYLDNVLNACTRSPKTAAEIISYYKCLGVCKRDDDRAKKDCEERCAGCLVVKWMKTSKSAGCAEWREDECRLRKWYGTLDEAMIASCLRQTVRSSFSGGNWRWAMKVERDPGWQGFTER